MVEKKEEKMPRSKQKKVILENTGDLPYGKSYCRRCQKLKNSNTDFYKTTDPELDKNGLMSVCKDCINGLYAVILQSEHNSIERTMLRLCRMLNVKYDESAIYSAIELMKSKQSGESKLFGYYRIALLTMNRSNVSDTLIDLTYMDNPIINYNTIPLNENEVDKEVISFWGDGYAQDEYRWLEKSLDEWKKTHKCDTKAEETLLREIVFKQFEIEKARKETKSTATLVKELQDLMKTASVDPAKANIAGSGKSQDSFGTFIKMIEENEPAEVFGEERDAFKDFQGIEAYYEKYVVRPLKNFITMSRDFSLDSDEEENSPNEVDDFEPLNYNPEEDGDAHQEGTDVVH